jgi:hypothetical protein
MTRFAPKALVLAICALPVALQAAEAKTSPVKSNDFSYNYAQLGYVMQDWDGAFDVDAIDAQLSMAIDEHLFLRGQFQVFDGDFDVGFVDADTDGWLLGAGVGFNTPLADDLDLVVTGDLVHIKYENDGYRVFGVRVANVDDDDTGIRLTGGVRMRATQELELAGGLYLNDVGPQDDIGLFGDALLHLNDQFDVGAGVKLGGDLTEFGVFGRYNF